jgi:hypothetical protein
MLLATLALLTSPVSPLLGDWDLGPSMPALRILDRDSDSVAVFFCDRTTLLSAHTCNSTVIFNFAYDNASQSFIHNDAATGTYATIKMKSDAPQLLDYSTKNDSGSSDYVGTKLP